MATVEEDPIGECTDENQDRSANSLASPDANDIFGDPQVLARVGDQYQVEVPPLVTESDILQLLKNPVDQEFVGDRSHSFLVGLPIAIVWIHDEFDSAKKKLLGFCETSGVKTNGSRETENNNGSNINFSSEYLEVKGEALHFTSNSARDLASCKFTAVVIERNVGSTLLPHEILKLEKNKVQGYCPAPGSISNSWSHFEQESFLLGLYIFGKNFVHVKKFMGSSKGMGDILSFYYGIFYRSEGHQRWSECRKIRSKRCIHGQRIFTGSRLQEFLSRLIPRVPEECQNTLLEVSKKFEDGNISLEEYVWSLKAKIGMELFIEVVGIGKGKKDLTGIIKETPKSSQVINTRLEVPVGKSCSSLTYAEIVRFLTGDFQLSKARCNDIFWEAVWPRLLENGWHSQKPKRQNYAHSKPPLVFLVPGIQKFSRRKLVNGIHYFDSESDVLNKVASEPRLIELKSEVCKGSRKVEGYECGVKSERDRNGDFYHQSCRFLQSRGSKTIPDLMNFTIVDTSVDDEEEPFTVTKLRTLPVDATTGSTPSISSISRKDDRYNFKKQVDKLFTFPVLSNDQMKTKRSCSSTRISDGVLSSGKLGCGVSALEQRVPVNCSEPTNAQMDCPRDAGDSSISGKSPDKIIAVDNKDDGDIKMAEKNPSKMIKCQFSRRRKHGRSSNLAPVTKRRKLTACSHEDANRNADNSCIVSGVEGKELHLHLGSRKEIDCTFSGAGPSHEKLPTSSSSKGSLQDNIEDLRDEQYFDKTASSKKSLPRTLIDLNLPQFPSDSESSDKCTTTMENNQDIQNINISSIPSEANHHLEDSQDLNTVNHVATAEEPPVITRRQGTRNRPLTTKAMEALACGFLTTNGRWRGMEFMPEENLTPKPSRRSRGKVSSATNFGAIASPTAESKEKQRLAEDCSSNPNMVNGPHVLSGRVS